MEKLILVLSLLLPGALCNLPTTFSVTSYALTLTVPSDITSNVVGSVTITLNCVTDTNVITLHWGSSLVPTNPQPTTDLTVTYLAPGSTTAAVPVTFTTSVNALNQLIITAASGTTFVATGTVTITANFQTRLNSDSKGLFYRQYIENGNKTVLLTNLRPTFARELFPCLDELGFSAPLTLTLNYPNTWSAFAATATTQNTGTGPTAGTLQAVFNPVTLPPNTFALFLAQDMAQGRYTVDRSTTALSFWARKNLAGATLAANVKFLADYYYMVEDILNINLPLTQLTIVMVPGLEEPIAGYGVIFIREDNYARDYTSPQVEGLFKSLVAPVVYQFIRQFSEFSTRPSSWSDYWVSQAVAKYMQYLILNTVMPFSDFKTDLEVVARQTALYLDALPDAKALQDTSVNTDSAASVQALINDPLKSLKGATILNMLDQALPAGTVFTAIKTFLTTSIPTIVTSTNFANQIKNIQNSPVLSQDAKSSLTTTLDFYLTTTSYPLEAVKIFKTGTPGTVNFTTTRFCSALNPSCTTTLPGAYYLSATVGSKSDNRFYSPRQDFWATNNDAYRSTFLNVQDTDWVVANMKSGGYYRSSYDADNWGRIIAAFSSNDQRLMGRTQLVDDAFALSFSSATLDFNITVKLALANLGNTLYRDWVPVQRGLRGIRDNVLGLDSYTFYQKFAAGYFLNLDRYLQNTSSDAFEKARIQALFQDDMCEYDITGYRSYAISNLTALLKGDLPTTVPSSAYDAVACCGARYNNNLKASTLWAILSDRTVNYYGRRFASVALGCLSNYTDIAQFFNTMTSTNIQLKPYIQIALENVAERNPVDFLADVTQLADKLQPQLGAVPVASLIVRAGRKVNNNTDALVLDNLNNNANVDTVVKTAASSTKDAIASKVTWITRNSPNLVATLKIYTLPSTSSGVSILPVISLVVFLPSLLLKLAPMSV